MLANYAFNHFQLALIQKVQNFLPSCFECYLLTGPVFFPLFPLTFKALASLPPCQEWSPSTGRVELVHGAALRAQSTMQLGLLLEGALGPQTWYRQGSGDVMDRNGCEMHAAVAASSSLMLEKSFHCKVQLF